MTIIWIGLAAGIGAVARYTISRLMEVLKKWEFPMATWLINITGALLIGMIFGEHFEQELSKILATGFCGGFTTFSTFNFELFALLEERKYKIFFSYFFSSYILGFVAVSTGYFIGSSS